MDALLGLGGWSFSTPSVHHFGVEKWTSVDCLVGFVFGLFLFDTGMAIAGQCPVGRHC